MSSVGTVLPAVFKFSLGPAVWCRCLSDRRRQHVRRGCIGDSGYATGVNGNQSNTSDFLAGAAFVFVRASDSWAQRDYVKAPNTQVQQEFGATLALMRSLLCCFFGVVLPFLR